MSQPRFGAATDVSFSISVSLAILFKSSILTSSSFASDFLDANQEKKVAICVDVKKYSLVKRGLSFVSFPVLIALATDAGLAFCPVSSPILNLDVS